ncbi:hypothetical protein [Runella sp.]|jgi:hypothetical protein|uniref:hypothetical protein n=1 Tax=Runella sp. TaxID=1960881 RepID=UPI002631AA8A|nr:hypothetical protein [Runella sp.]
MKQLPTKVPLFLAILLFIGGCGKKEQPTPAEENELITTVRLKFTENGTTNTQTFQWKDLDGDGGNAPTITSIVLRASRTYKLDVEFLDESSTPAVNKTADIQSEADKHLIAFTPIPSSLFTYTAGDKDSRNFPLGLTGTVITSFTNMGTLRVQLRHQPPINGQPVKNGTITPGSDDVNVTFSITVAP